MTITGPRRVRLWDAFVRSHPRRAPICAHRLCTLDLHFAHGLCMGRLYWRHGRPGSRSAPLATARQRCRRCRYGNQQRIAARARGVRKTRLAGCVDDRRWPVPRISWRPPRGVHVWRQLSESASERGFFSALLTCRDPDSCGRGRACRSELRQASGTGPMLSALRGHDMHREVSRSKAGPALTRPAQS